MNSIWNDVRYALRVLKKDRGFSLTCILTIAAGMGAATSIFSVVNSVLLKPIPYADSEHLVLIRERLRKVRPEPLDGMPAPDTIEYGKSVSSLQGSASYVMRDSDFVAGSGEPMRVHAARTAWTLFQLLGATPALGRTFTEQEDRERNRVVILGHRLWESRFASDPNVIGKKVLIDRNPYTVVGVMRPEFSFPYQSMTSAPPADLWTPMAYTNEELKTAADDFNYSLIARIKPGLSLARVNAELEAVAQRIHERYPAAMRGELTLETIATPIQEKVVGDSRPLLLLLSGAVLFLLLIACVNAANLLLSRGATREREFAVRLAIGADRSSVIRQLLVESTLLSFTGGVLGLFCAWWGTALLARVTSANIPRLSEVSIDGVVLIFSLSLSVATGIFFGVIPAFLASRADLNTGLREGGRGTTSGRSRYRLRAGLVVAEVSLSLLLLVGSGLFLRSFLQLQNTDPGFRTEHVLSLELSLPESQYASANDVRQFKDSLLSRLLQLPGVTAATVSTNLPVHGSNWSRLATPLGGSLPERGEPLINYSLIDGGYFETLGIRLKKGRWFAPTDNNPKAGVAIISESMARTFWPGEDAVGKLLKWGPPQGDGYRVSTVIGVVADVKDSPTERKAMLQAYEPLQQADDETLRGAMRSPAVAVRAALPPEKLTNAVRQAVHSLDSQMPISHLEPMDQLVSESLSPRRFQTAALGGFAAIALLLAAIGIYGVVSYSVAQRRQEIGVRVALGASRSNVLTLILRQALTLSAAGIAVGFACALGFTRSIASLLYQVAPNDAATYGAVAVILLLTTIVAALAPGLKAMRTDPMTALRSE